MARTHALRARTRWVDLQEIRESLKNAAKWQEETNRQIKENAKQIGGLGGRYGEMVEFLVKPNLVHKFRELGFEFTKAHHNTNIKDEKNNILAQIDFTLEDGDKVMIVEVKSTPSIEDIKDHVTRMEKVRRHADLHNDTRKYLGAVAGMVIYDNERAFILKNGFYAIEPSGETFIITPPPEDSPAAPPRNLCRDGRRPPR